MMDIRSRLQKVISALTPSFTAQFSPIAITISELRELQMPGKQYAIFTSWKTGDGGESRHKNKGRQSGIIEELEQAELRWEKTLGKWGVPEQSLFVWDAPWGLVTRLAKKYGQQAIVYKPANGPAVIYTMNSNEATFPARWAIVHDIVQRDPRISELPTKQERKEETEKLYHTRFRRFGPALEYIEKHMVPLRYSGRPLTYGDVFKQAPQAMQHMADAYPEIAKALQEYGVPLYEPKLLPGDVGRDELP